ncbi:MAG: hypothetical protein WDZ85_02305 [Candidatus Paceibacterota bacterium]
MINFYRKLDYYLIALARKINRPFARLVIFIIFIWFGYLKVIGVSSANPLVEDLLVTVLPFITFSQFIVVFGIFEILIGWLFILPRVERLAIFLLLVHMVMTALPLFLLPAVSWQAFGVPTLEGQYIIKNLAIISLVLIIGAKLSPRMKSRS